MTERVRVDLGDRGYDVVVGAGALDELARSLARPAPGRGRHASRRSPTHATASPPRSTRAGVEHHDRSRWATARTRSRSPPSTSSARGFAQLGLLRGDAVVALGGGVVGDTAGFAAACTTAASPSCRCRRRCSRRSTPRSAARPAVNLPEGKNLVGAFHQPSRCSPTPTLATLPDREYRCGLGEVAKYALARRRRARRARRRARRRDARARPDVLAELVAALRGDQGARRRGRPAGAHRDPRASLNYGHTLAHALETAGGYELLHGEAVAVGLVFAAPRGGAASASAPTWSTGTEASSRRSGCRRRAARAVDATTCSRDARATRRRRAGSRSCSPGPTGSSASTIRPAPCARRRVRRRSGVTS